MLSNISDVLIDTPDLSKVQLITQLSDFDKIIKIESSDLLSTGDNDTSLLKVAEILGI
jgi:hypothetical protein